MTVSKELIYDLGYRVEINVYQKVLNIFFSALTCRVLTTIGFSYKKYQALVLHLLQDVFLTCCHLGKLLQYVSSKGF